MRLIDADALLERNNLKNCTKHGNKTREQQEHSYGTMMNYEIADMIEDAPTAYDVEQVMERLAQRRYDPDVNLANRGIAQYVGYCNGLGDAAGIVKGGGL